MKKKLNSIMLIDDDEDDNFFHQIIIKEAGITDQVKISESGFEALEHIKTSEQKPELIFLDINMPKMNGWEFIEEYIRLNLANNCIIIMLTTSLNPADLEKSRKIPCISDFKTKPLDIETLNGIYEKFFSLREN